VPVMISIVVPAYKAEKFIDKTIESVLKQTYTDWELIIINDGSPDATEARAQAYASDRIRVVSQKNSGVSIARNHGIALAKGEYIAFLDADDYWLPNNLSDKIALFEKYPDADFVFSNFYIGDENLVIREKGPEGTDENMLENYLYWKRAVIPGASSNLLVRKTCFDSGLRFDPQFSTAADQDFCFYLVKNFKGRHLNEYTCIYRILANSMSRNMTVFTKDHIGVYKKAADKHLFKNFFQKQRCFSNMYLIVAGGWWVNGGSKLKSMKFMLLALLHNPGSIFSLMQKLRFSK